MQQLMDLLLEYMDQVIHQSESLPLKLEITPAEIRAIVDDSFDFSQAQSQESAFHQAAQLLHKWSVHSNHPRYFGLFVPHSDALSVAGEALTSLYNPQIALWDFSPVGIAMEEKVLDVFLDRLGWDMKERTAHFTTGGSEANHTAVLAALTKHFPNYGSDGIHSLPSQPVFYLSEESHHCFQKIAHATGLGRANLKTIPVTDGWVMDLLALEAQIAMDCASGATPFLVVGTAGTTSAGQIEPLSDIAAICQRHQLWFHVDAAWAGAALISDRLSRAMPGIEAADSLTIDAHKWLAMPTGAGMFFCRHAAIVGQTFDVHTPYVPEALPGDVISPYRGTMQWSRRMVGLKLFLALATYGKQGLASRLERMADLGEFLRETLVINDWILLNHTPLPLVCFTHPCLDQDSAKTQTFVQAVVKRGQTWISKTVLGGKQPAIRACITGYRSTKTDVTLLVDELNAVRQHFTYGISQD